MAQAILHPEDSLDYPDTVKTSEARRAFFDYFNKDETLAVNIDSAAHHALRPDWKRNFQKQQNIRLAIYENYWYMVMTKMKQRKKLLRSSK